MAEQSTPPRKRRRQKGRSSLSTRLSRIILPLILIPLLLIGVGAYLRSRQVLENQATAQMTSALQAQIESLQEWLLKRHSRLYVNTVQQELVDLSTFFLENPDIESIQKVRDVLLEMRYWNNEELFSDLFILRLNPSGTPEILVSSNSSFEGKHLESLGSLSTNQIETIPVFNLTELDIDGLVFLSSAPLRTQGTTSVNSLLVGVNSGLRIGALLDTMQVYWEQRGIYRVELGNTLLLMKPDIAIRLSKYSTEPEIETNVNHPVFHSDTTTNSGTLSYSLLDGEPMLASYQWLPNWDMALVIELSKEQAFSGLNTLAPLLIVLILATTLLVGLLIPIVTRRSLKPLDTLTSFSEQVASGNLEQRVSIESKDEIGRLARSFNNMADELSQLYRSLEQRVAQRTEDIRLAADIARDVTAIRNIDSFLNDVVQLVSERFGYYHTAIFLSDEEKEYVQMRAASSEGGKVLLQRGYILPIGESSVVGYVADTGDPRIAQIVEKDLFYTANPELPLTKAEAVLPLNVSDETIGVLDIQSQVTNSFHEGDIHVLQIIADQVAVAVENTRLLRLQTTLAELRSKVIHLFNRLNQQIKIDDLLEEIPKSIRETFNLSRVTLGLVEGETVVVRSVSSSEDAITPSPIDTSPIGEGVLGRTVFLRAPQRVSQQHSHELETQDPRKSQTQTIFAIPLSIRDKVIGTVALETGYRGDLTKDEIDSLELVASQAAISIENSQLLEELRKSLEQMDSLYRQQTADSWAQLLSRQTEKGETLFEDGQRLQEESVDKALQASIELRGKMIGRLNLHGLRYGEWVEDDREILEAVADEVANALEQARLIEEINRKVAQLQIAAEIARSASGFLELDALLNKAVHLIRERFGFYHISIFLLDDNRETAILRETSGEAASLLKEKPLIFPVGSKSVVGRVTEVGKYYIANQIKSDPYYTPHPVLPDTQSELGIPLKIGEEVIGALDVMHNKPFAFSEEDISILQLLADQIAIAVQNVYLFQRTYQRAQREKSVVEITSRIRAEKDIDKMLQTAILEMHNVLGAKKARIQLTIPKSNRAPTSHPFKDEGDNGNPAMDQPFPFQTNESD